MFAKSGRFLSSSQKIKQTIVSEFFQASPINVCRFFKLEFRRFPRIKVIALSNRILLQIWNFQKMNSANVGFYFLNIWREIHWKIHQLFIDSSLFGNGPAINAILRTGPRSSRYDLVMHSTSLMTRSQSPPPLELGQSDTPLPVTTGLPHLWQARK